MSEYNEKTGMLMASDPGSMEIPLLKFLFLVEVEFLFILIFFQSYSSCCQESIKLLVFRKIKEYWINFKHSPSLLTGPELFKMINDHFKPDLLTN